MSRLLDRVRAHLGADGSRSSRGDDGDTLLEVLLALAVLGIAALAILLGFSTSIIGSSEYRTVATNDTVLRTAAEQATNLLQAAPTSAWDACTDAQLTSTQFSLPAGYTASLTSVSYWNKATSSFVATCVPDAAQLVTVTVVHGSSSNSVSFIVEDPQALPAIASGAATQLVFIGQPGSTVSGSSISPPPIVAVEDAHGAIVTTDLSPVSLVITPGTGASGATLSGDCAGSEFYGVVTFSNCSIIAVGSNYQLTASDGLLTPATSQPFAVSSAPATQLAFTQVPSGNQSPSLTASSGPFEVQEQDLFGNPVVSSAPLTVDLSTTSTGIAGNAPFFSLTTGGGPATAVTSVVIPAGASTSPPFYYADAAAGMPTLTATNPSMIAASASVTIPAGAASALGFTTPPPATASPRATFTVGVAVEDGFGNVLTGTSSVSVRLSASGGSGFTCSGSLTRTVVAGVATFTGCDYPSSGSSPYTLTASATGLVSATAQTSVSAGPAVALAYTTPPPSSTTAGSTFAVTVAEQDALGNVETGDSTTVVTLSATGSGFACADPLAKAVTSGVVTFSGCSYPTGSATPSVLTAAAPGLTPAVAQTTVVGPAATVAFTVPPPSSVGAGSTFSVGAAVEDAYGNVVTGDSTTTIALAATSGSGFACTGSLSRSVVSGVATWAGCAYTKASTAPDTLTASAAGLTSASAQTTVSAGAARTLLFGVAPPASATAGSTFAVSVTEQDAYGNVETGDSTTTIALAATGGSGFACTGSLSRSVVSGDATWAGCAYTKASTTPYSLTASAAGLTSASAQTTVSHAAPDQLAFATQPQTFESGTSGPAGSGTITVQLQDQYGNAAPAPPGGVVVALSSSSGTGSFSSSPVTIVMGTSSASFTYFDTTPGTPTLTATDASLPTPTATQAETVLATASGTSVTVGAPSPGTVSAGSSATYAVTVTNTSGHARSFSVTSVGGLPAGTSWSASASCVRITNSGTITLTVSTSSSSPDGTSTLAAVVTAASGGFGGCGTAAGTSQGDGTLTVSAPATQLVFGQEPTSAVHGQAIAPPVTVLVEDSSFDVVTTSSASITVAIGSDPGGGSLSGTVTAGAASGVAQFPSLRINTAAAGYTLTATSAGLAGAVTDPFDVT